MSTEVQEGETGEAARGPVEPLRLLAVDSDDLQINTAALNYGSLRPV